MEVSKKKLLAIGPITPKYSEIVSISDSLNFLRPNYEIKFFDSLENVSNDTSSKNFYFDWLNRLKYESSNFDGFLGFSFGGVILQKSFTVFNNINKPIILFSTPSFIDHSLSRKLTAIVEKIKSGRLTEAIQYLDTNVFYPNIPPKKSYYPDNSEEESLRMIKGIEFILTADSRKILGATTNKYLHFVGDESLLVNRDNVVQSINGKIDYVPVSGMRVLQDNPHYCINKISEFLSKWQ